MFSYSLFVTIAKVLRNANHFQLSSSSIASRSAFSRSSSLSKLLSKGSYSTTSSNYTFFLSFFSTLASFSPLSVLFFFVYFFFFYGYFQPAFNFLRFLGSYTGYCAFLGLFLLLVYQFFICCSFCFLRNSSRFSFMSFREVNSSGILYLQFFDTKDKYLLLQFASILDSETVSIYKGSRQYRKVCANLPTILIHPWNFSNSYYFFYTYSGQGLSNFLSQRKHCPKMPVWLCIMMIAKQYKNNIKDKIIQKRPSSSTTTNNKINIYLIYQYIQIGKMNPQSLQYKPLIISGCSGVGKGTLINFLTQKYPNLFQLSISLTTRNPRNGEQNGREYYFVDKEQFKKQIQNNVFAEYCQVHGNFYGTHQGKLDKVIHKHKICILDIDLQGGQKIHAKKPQYNYLFIDGPSLQIIQSRLRSRKTDSEQAIQKRMKNAKGELQVVKQLPYYQHILNDDLEKAKETIVGYINKKYGLALSI